MKKLLLVFVALIVLSIPMMSTTSASALVRVENDDNQVYQLENSDLKTIMNFLANNSNKKLELWIDYNSNKLQEIMYSINVLDTPDNYLIIYNTESSDKDGKFYAKIKFLPIR